MGTKRKYKSINITRSFFTFIDGDLVVGGVEIFPHETIEGALAWRTIIYKGANINSLERCFKGPDGMKGYLRLVQLQDKRIGVLSQRPQGEKEAEGKIGFIIVDSIEDLTIEAVENAELFENQFTDSEWGGANAAYVLKDGRIGVLGHVACFDEKEEQTLLLYGIYYKSRN